MSRHDASCVIFRRNQNPGYQGTAGVAYSAGQRGIHLCKSRHAREETQQQACKNNEVNFHGTSPLFSKMREANASPVKKSADP
jgi:hypothetical protein